MRIVEKGEWTSHINKPPSPLYKETWLKDENPPQDFQMGKEAHLSQLPGDNKTAGTWSF